MSEASQRLRGAVQRGVVRTHPHLGSAQIERIVRDVLEAIANDLGGGTCYIPTPRRLLAPWRDEQVRAEFNGSNASGVCERHGISRSRLYQIINNPPEE